MHPSISVDEITHLLTGLLTLSSGLHRFPNVTIWALHVAVNERQK